MTALTKGVHHVGLTVTSAERASSFFIETLGFKQVGEKPDYPAIFVSDGHVMLTLWQVAEPAAAAPFDRKRALGLHHVALQVDDVAKLSQLHEALQTINDVQLEFAPEKLGTGPAHHMMCLIPGGVRVEFIAPNG